MPPLWCFSPPPLLKIIAQSLIFCPGTTNSFLWAALSLSTSSSFESRLPELFHLFYLLNDLCVSYPHTPLAYQLRRNVFLFASLEDGASIKPVITSLRSRRVSGVLKEARNSFFGLGVYLLKSKFRIEGKLRFTWYYTTFSTYDQRFFLLVSSQLQSP